MIAVLPEAKGPCSSMVSTLGFHSPRWRCPTRSSTPCPPGQCSPPRFRIQAWLGFYSPDMKSSGTPLGYGIDFGTSNSAISIAYPDHVEVLALGAARSSLTLPSFVYLHRSGRRDAGDEGVKTFLKSGHRKTDCWKCPLAPYGWDTECRQYRKGGGCSDARLLSGVKHELAKLGFVGTNSWATDVSVVMKRLKTEADARATETVTSVVLGHPVVFAGADPVDRAASDREAFRRLEEAARTAGFEEVAFLPEPTAAVICEATHK